MTTIATYNKTAWLSNYPSHWQVLRIKSIFSEIEDKSTCGNEELLSVSHYTGVTLKRNSLDNEDDFITNAESLEGYKKVVKGDLVINIMLAWNGSLGISPFDGITSPAYCVYRVKENNNPEYFGYLFATNLMKTEFRKKSTGIINSRLRLYSDKFFSIFSIIPPLEEQNQIVQYIKVKEEKINHFIAKKQHFIELLKEQRQSVINEAVTKVGKNWTNKRLKYLANLKFSSIDKHIIEGEEIVRLCNYVDVYKNDFITNKMELMKASATNDEIEKFTVLKNDIIITKDSETADDIAVPAFVIEDLDNVVCGYHLALIRADENQILSEYLFRVFQSKKINSHFRVGATGVTRVGLSLDDIAGVFIPYPNLLEEQTEIVNYIKIETAAIDKAISKTEREIELIKEYKEAMIAEAVMGKINISELVHTIQTKAKTESTWEFKEAVLISVLTDKFGSAQFPLGRKRYTKFSYLFHRYTDNKTEGYLKKAAGPYNPKTKYGGPEKIALQNKYIAETQNGKLSGFVPSEKIQEAKNYFGHYWKAESLNWLEQLRYKKNDELELYATVDKTMVELAIAGKTIYLQSVKQVIKENPEWKPKLERDIFSDENITNAIKFLKQLFA